MPHSSTPVGPLAADTLSCWLAERVEFHLDLPAGSIDSRVGLAQYGVDSVHAISLIGDIEDRFPIEVDLGTLRDCTTIRDIAGYVTGLVSDDGVE